MASVERHDGGEPNVVGVEEHATHGSFEFGDLVKFASNGKVQIATAGAIDGIARKKYTGTENTIIPVELIDANGIYSVRYKASATAVSLRGDCVDFTFTAGEHTVDESGADTDAYVVGFDERDAIGTSGGRLLIRFYGTLLTATST